MTDVFSKAKRRSIMQAVRRADTAPERELASLLKSLGYKFRRHPRTLPGRPDLYFAQGRLAVFVHGCFWHGHHACRKGRTPTKTRADYWQDKVSRNRARDRRVGRKLRALGISVYTVWECEIAHGRIPVRVMTAIARVQGSATRGQCG